MCWQLREHVRRIMATTINERPLTRAEAAEFLSSRGFRVAYSTLNKYATVGGGPAFESFGRKPLYKPTDLLRWAAGKTARARLSTSEQRIPLAEHAIGLEAHHAPEADPDPKAIKSHD